MTQRTAISSKDSTRRAKTRPWKHVYGTDRKYTARIDRLNERNESSVPSDE